ncbi:MAG: heme ABC transporter ATP-binding protein [Firmicutes bacterium]|nr:heme ABC transporter ATP-binding protein [Bacillota bacterium]
MDALLAMEHVEFRHNGSFALQDMNLTVPPGDFLGIIGPNGSGKSTALRLLAGYLRPQKGRVLLANKDISKLSRNQVAKQVAVVSQGTATDFEFTVEEVVRMGRLPYLKRWQTEAPGDSEIVEEALATTGIAPFRHRQLARLSGGEAQRVLLAQALAQQPKVLLLDEPTTYLDMAHQQEFFNLMARLNSQGVTIVAVLHDLNLAALYCRRLVAMKAGRVMTTGDVDTVITAANIRALYGCPVEVFRHPRRDKPQVSMLPADTRLA